MTVCLAPNPWLQTALALLPALGLTVLMVSLGCRTATIRAGLRSLSPIRTGAALAVAVLVLVPWYHLVPPGHAVYYDEFNHAETTANLAAGDGGVCCLEYAAGKCRAGGPIVWPLSTHMAAAGLAMTIRDQNPPRRGVAARQALNFFYSLASILLIVAWLRRLEFRFGTSLFMAAGYGLLPARLKLVSSGALMPGALFFLVLSLLAAEMYRRDPRLRNLLFVCAAMVLTLHSRLEMFLVVPPLLWRIGGTSPREDSGRPWPVLLFLVAVFLIAEAPLAWLWWEGGRQGAAGWSESAGRSLEHLASHLPGNLMFLVNPRFASPGLIIGGLVGSLWLRRDGGWGWTVAGLASLLFYSLYHIGTFAPHETLDGWRYSLIPTLLILPAAAALVERLFGCFGGKATARVAFHATVAGILTLPVALQTDFLTKEHPLGSFSGDLRRLPEIVDGLPARPTTLITTEVAWVKAVSGLDATQSPIGSDPAEPSGPPGTEGHMGPTLLIRAWGEQPPTGTEDGATHLGKQSAWTDGHVVVPVEGLNDPGDGKGPWLHLLLPARTVPVETPTGALPAGTGPVGGLLRQPKCVLIDTAPHLANEQGG